MVQAYSMTPGASASYPERDTLKGSPAEAKKNTTNQAKAFKVPSGS